MREILFRGKLVNHDDWIFGQYYRSYYDNDGEKGFTHCISNEKGAYSVQPATVGQFTGLGDKNGKRIFEGDVVKCGINGRKTGVVNFEINGWFIDSISLGLYVKNGIEVIGNIYDK
jgi:uncharacterized phage protein (TIGR01671 family)